MEPSTTIKNMMKDGRITVPTYQRAYSWETPREQSFKKTHTNIFFADLDEYSNSHADTPYYFGHFLFEKKGSQFYVIDGQQRLTTISIFLSALFAKLRSLRDLSENEIESFEDMVKRNSKIRFATVDYDNQVFIDYVAERSNSNRDKKSLETESARRIIFVSCQDSCHFFHAAFS